MMICSLADGGAFPPPGAPPRGAAGAAPRPACGNGAAAPRAAPGNVHAVVVGTPAGAVPPPPNIRTTGTGPFALFGVLSVASIVTFNSGYAELSTRPTSCFVMIGTLAVTPSVVLATVHVTFGMVLGRRP